MLSTMNAGSESYAMIKGGEVMANKNEDHLVVCPYYKTNNPSAIYCEGFENGMVVHIAFASRDQLVNYKSRYCRRHCWARCPLATTLNRKWGYDE